VQRWEKKKRQDEQDFQQGREFCCLGAICARGDARSVKHRSHIRYFVVRHSLFGVRHSIFWQFFPARSAFLPHSLSC
jgi:hypothetical protein